MPNPGVQTWGEYLAAKQAKAVTPDEGEVEDKAVKKAATKGRSRKTDEASEG